MQFPHSYSYPPPIFSFPNTNQVTIVSSPTYTSNLGASDQERGQAAIEEASDREDRDVTDLLEQYVQRHGLFGKIPLGESRNIYYQVCEENPPEWWQELARTAGKELLTYQEQQEKSRTGIFSSSFEPEISNIRLPATIGSHVETERISFEGDFVPTGIEIPQSMPITFHTETGVSTNNPSDNPPVDNPPGIRPRKRKRGRKRIDTSNRVCKHCGEIKTSQWRRGPLGMNTLCNKCGLLYAKRLRQSEARKGKSDFDYILNP